MTDHPHYTYYTPDTQTVREQYTREEPHHIGTVSSRRGEFDRWYADLIRKAKEQAWEEGYRSGHSRAMRRMSDEPQVPPATNPYTEES